MDADGNETGRGFARISVSPKEPLMLEELGKLAEGVEVPSGTVQLSLIVIDGSGETVGSLALSRISN